MAKKKKAACENEKRQALQFFRKNELAKANTLYAQIYKNNPKDFDACFMLGVIAQKAGNRDQAIRLLSRATGLKKNAAKAHYRLGLAYRDAGDLESALPTLQQAVAIKPDYVEAYEALTGLLQASGRHGDLIQACREAINAMPNEIEFHARLAGALEQKSQLEAARQVAEKALQLDARHPRIHFTLAKVDRREGHLESARDRLRSLLGMNLPAVQYSAVAGELGEVLDRMGDFDAAFDSFDRANKAMLRTAAPGLLTHNPVLEKIARCKAFFSASSVAGWAQDEPQDGLDAPIFLVGFPRSGTTLTEQILAASDAIQPSDEQPVIERLLREIPEVTGRVFTYPQDLLTLSGKELGSLRARYWELVQEMVGEVPAGKRFLDKLPLNMIDLGLIHRLFPRASVLVVLRDPRDACLSCFMRQFVLNEAMIHFTGVRQTGEFYAAVMGLWLHYRETLPLRFLEVRYEDLVDDLEGAARSLLEFLGIEWNEGVLRFFEKVGQRDVRTPSYSAVSSPIYKRAVGRWMNYRSHLAPLMDRLAPFIREFGYDV